LKENIAVRAAANNGKAGAWYPVIIERANVSQADQDTEMPPRNSRPVFGNDAAQAGRTILLVEDESFVRKVTREILQSAGYHVLEARNAAEAMREFHGYGKEVQLLLTDVVMPGRTGRDLAHDLRGICTGLKTIFISGYPENAVTRNGLQERGWFYLPKPFSAESLVEKVRQVLEEPVPSGARAGNVKRVARAG
jgi:two-component system cell cycle sensor histidine kinase/response regulator CckA